MSNEFDVVGWEEEMEGAAPSYQHSRPQYGRSNLSQRGTQRGGMQQRQQPFGRGSMQQMHQPGQMGPGGLLPTGAPVPPWFRSAFGVAPNAEQMHTLPLTPQTNGGVFAAAVSLIFFQARPQRPFRGERPVAILQATGASAAGVQPFSTLITVGVIPQQVEIGNIPITLWAATAFGVRLAMTDAAPGVLINFPISLPTPNPITGTDTLLVQLVIIGRVLA